MRGQEALIALRRAGKRPAIVDISDGLDSLGAWRDWQHWCGTAHVEVQPTDRISRLDLRCVVGLFVVIGGGDAARVQQLHDACVEAGASAVMGAVYERTAGGDLRRLDSIETFPEAA